MRVRTVLDVDGRRRVAVWARGGWIPLSSLAGSERLAAAGTDLLGFLQGGVELRAQAEALAASGRPVCGREAGGLPFRPAGFRDCSLWEEHVVKAGRGLLRLQGGPLFLAARGYEQLVRRPFPPLRPKPLWHEKPLYYKGSAGSCIGDGEVARWPSYTQALDYELEIGLVIAREVVDATAEQAIAAVGGFLLVNDLSARDVQYREMVEGRMGPAKSKDFATALGPVVVTPDEFQPLLADLRCEVWANGTLVATGSTAGMAHSISEVVAYASAGERLAVGEVIGLGTVPGCCALENGAWVSPGDVLELRAGPLGSLTTVIGQPEPWVRAAGALPRTRWSVVCRAGEEPDPRGVRPDRWHPPPVPAMAGPLTPNDALDRVQQLALPGGAKPEDVVLDSAGRLYTGVEDGRVYRWPASPHPGSRPELYADTHGRPLGLEIDPRDGALLVCDAYRGLLRVPAAGQVRVLADGYHGRRFRFVNNAAVAGDGTVYFSDTSSRFRIEHFKHDLLEHRPSGRIFRYCPAEKRVSLCADGMYFPNGVALTPDESALLVCETGTYRLIRVELSGSAAGKRTVLTDLPGFPDNISAVGDGTYWVAVLSLRVPILDATLPLPLARRAIARVPPGAQPAARRYGLVVQVDSTGRILRSLHGPAGAFSEISGARQHQDWLYLGSLAESSVGRVRLPPTSPGQGSR